MNDKQRSYLIGQVEKTCTEQTRTLESGLPIRPSLNNYLVAACLDNTLKMQDVETLKEKIRQAVLKYGKDDQLVSESDDDGYSYNRRSRKTGYKQEVTLMASDLFVIPEAYLKALKEYEDKDREIKEKVKSLEAQKDTIVLKIQIGSANALDKLVMQVDNMGDLNLMNTQLMLGKGEDEKK